MRTIRFLLATFSMVVLLPTFSPASPATSIRPPLSLEATSSFSLSTMTPEETKWYDRLTGAMDASALLADDFMQSDDSYTLGRDGGNYIESLLMALKATGDRRFLDRVYELTELARPRLRDTWLDGTSDGFTDWLWLADPTNATFYGKDTNWLDESIASGNVALWTYAFYVNRNLDPKFATAANFWRDWLENQFLAKWYRRVGGDPLVAWNTPFAAFYKPDVEPRSANWRLAYYLWKVTGNGFYKSRCDEIVAQLSAAQTLNPARTTAWRWARQLDPTSTEWQTINYANYYLRVVLEMQQEGMTFYSSPTTLQRFASTFRDVVYAGTLPGMTGMKNDVNGGGSTGFALYAFNGLSPWDATGTLMSLADKSIVGVGNYATGGRSKSARNDVYVSAYALMALETHPNATAVPEPTVGAALSLEQNDPNPFSSSTSIRFELPRTAEVRLSIFDAAGRQVRTLERGTLPAGQHVRQWDGRGDHGETLPDGIYFLTVDSGGRRMVRSAIRLQ